MTTFTLNGARIELDVPDHELLLDSLRERCSLFSVREGCNVGACGTCTVLLDGQPASSCLVFTSRLDDRTIVTSEGLGSEHGLSPVQKAFVEEAGYQCGYCTPGFVIMIEALLNENANPTEAEVREYLAGNLCRCGAYPNIFNAVRRAVELRATTQGQATPSP